MKYECIKPPGGRGRRTSKPRPLNDEEYFARLRARSQYTVDRIRSGAHLAPTTIHHSWK